MRISNHTVEVSRNVRMKINESRTKTSVKVNINNLMSKVRADYKKKKERKFSFFWFDWFRSSFNWNYFFFII